MSGPGAIGIFMSSLEIQEALLEFSRSRYEELRFRDLAGKQIAKGIKFAHELIQQTPVLDDPLKYAELLRELLEKERKRISGSADDDPEGAVLSGMAMVMNKVDEHRGNAGTP